MIECSSLPFKHAGESCSSMSTSEDGQMLFVGSDGDNDSLLPRLNHS